MIFFNSSVFINTTFKIPTGWSLWLRDKFKGFKMAGTGQSDPLAMEEVVGQVKEKCRENMRLDSLPPGASTQ